MDRLKEFEELVDAHDVTYNYSDDSSVWRRGQAQWEQIMSIAKDLPQEDVARIWNAKMDRYFLPEYAPEWYWQDLRKAQ